VDSYIALSYWDLAAASVLVFINAGLSVIFRLRVHRSLIIATIRMVVQLALVCAPISKSRTATYAIPLALIAAGLGGLFMLRGRGYRADTSANSDEAALRLVATGARGPAVITS